MSIANDSATSLFGKAASSIVLYIAGAAAMLCFVAISGFLRPPVPKPMNYAKAADITGSKYYPCLASAGADSRQTLVAPPDSNGQTIFKACVGGLETKFLFVSNVKPIILSWDLAVELNLKPNRLHFDEKIEFYRGSIKVAKTRAPNIVIGTATLSDVPVVVAERSWGSVNFGVAGQDFLKLMHRTEFVDGSLYLQASK